ncbi:MAG TPA: cytochrome P460 family protein [Burkholderiaceae bacterium]|nr:cytochrome P460 family protein [Burkholderiaceae bacterium]
MMKVLVLAVVAAAAVGCVAPAQNLTAGVYKDGQVRVPPAYETWTKKFDTIDRPEIKQVREIYVNEVGAQAKAGEPLPNGYVSVMEIWSAKDNGDTTVQVDESGRLVKDKLLKIFVMAKGEGWGEQVTPVLLRNGDWVYSAWLADGQTPAPDLAASCRGCHMSFAKNDFLPNYSGYGKTNAEAKQ